MASEARKPRVVWLCLEWPNDQHSGGVARYAYRLAKIVAGTVDLTVITEAGGDPVDAARMVYLPRSKGRVERYYRQPLRARKNLAAIDSIDVLHSFGDDWALKLKNVPQVRHFLGSSLSEAKASKGLRKWNHLLLAALEKRSQKRSAFRIAIGPESDSEFACHAIMPPVVPATIEQVEKYLRPTVVFVGSYYGRKRGAWVEKAVEAARIELDTEIDLLVFGPAGDSRHWSSGTTHISGAEDKSVHNAIARAWLIASPSSYEGFGIPIFEGLSLATAVVASSNPGADYQSSIVANTDALKIVNSEAEFVSAVIHRLSSGGVLPTDARAAMDSAVRELLQSGAAERLTREIYPSLLGTVIEGR